MRGFRDILPPLSDKFNYIRKVFDDFSNIYGVDLLELNYVEESDLYFRTSGENSEICNKELFEVRKFKSDYEGWVLRPEGTVSCVKLIKDNNYLFEKKICRVGYYGAMFRYNRPQKGRYRQFIQAGWEWLGSNNEYIDYEILIAACKILDFLKIDYQLEINSIGDFNDRLVYRNTLKNILKTDKDPFKLLDKFDVVSSLPEMKLNSKDQEIYNFICDQLKLAKINYIKNPYLVRGLDYYNGLVFEFKVKGKTILAGGRYDGLMEQLNGPSTPAIGFAMGVDRVVDVLTKTPRSNKIAVINIDSESYCLKILDSLRNYNFNCTPYWGYELSKALKLVVKYYDYAIIVGENEAKKQTFILKDLKNSIQSEKFLNEINLDLFNFLQNQ